MKKIIFLLLSITINLSLFSHPWKPNHYVIIDTDGGIDDMRAISMLLASPDVRVLAITVSPGTLNADSSYSKVKSLLKSLHHEGLPVGINRRSSFISPDYPVALRTSWGIYSGADTKNANESIRLLEEVLSIEKSKVSLICLGSMSTAALAFNEIRSFRDEVKEIIWSGKGVDDKNGFNYSIDRSSAGKILNGDLPVKAVIGPDIKYFYDSDMLKALSLVSGSYSAKIADFFKSGSVKDHGYSFEVNDEAVAVFLHYPSIFINEAGKGYSFCPSEKIPQFRESMLTILAGETVARNQVIKDFPVDPSFYFDDVEPNVDKIILKHGRDEWVSGVIANELHRHLGTFAIIGVKMGIRAREYFNTGVDEFRVVSNAGSIPPMSCMNDGLQVSTGATPGHGLLTVVNKNPAIPSSEFTYMNRTIRVTLKPEITEKISNELKEINYVYGLDSNIYWELVRKNTIKYWLDLDRHEIFEIEELQTSF